MEIINNPYFSAGFGLLGLTASFSLLKSSAVHLRSFMGRYQVPSKDASFAWILHWSQKYCTTKSILTLDTTIKRSFNGSASAAFSLVPGQGMHIIKYKNHYLALQRTREKNMLDIKSGGTPWETLQITVLNIHKQTLFNMLEEAKCLALDSERGKIVIYTAYSTEWFGLARSKRSLDSVVLSQGTAESVLNDVKTFLGNKSWYADRGIPYRRGYLLHGPPGTGKTSFIYALAGVLNYNICVLNLTERGMTDDKLAHLLSNVPQGCIILLEDVDSAFGKRKQNVVDGGGVSNSSCLVTFSGFLNALDGIVASADERLLFMTTNHVEWLDDALIRPGRVDFKVLIDLASSKQVYQMFEKFYKDKYLAEEFCSIVGDKRCSPAMLQGHFVQYQNDVVGAVKNAHSLV